MDQTMMLAFTVQWFHYVFLLGLIGVIIFYVIYRREQM
jgi:hypothetical protein